MFILAVIKYKNRDYTISSTNYQLSYNSRRSFIGRCWRTALPRSREQGAGSRCDGCRLENYLQVPACI
nr:MAG TPA_asm: hypothetical protein [Caudoviricetes sp.]